MDRFLLEQRQEYGMVIPMRTHIQNVPKFDLIREGQSNSLFNKQIPCSRESVQ